MKMDLAKSESRYHEYGTRDLFTVSAQIAIGRKWRSSGQKLLVELLFAVSLMATPSVACAQIASCSVASGTVAFGGYDPVIANLSAPLDAAGTFSYTCRCTGSAMLCRFFPPTIAVQIDLSTGQSLSYAERQTALVGSPTDRLGYNLYLDSARTTVWGDGNGGTGHYTATLSVPRRGVTTNLSVYGRITGGQDVPPGSYADQITITMTY